MSDWIFYNYPEYSDVNVALKLSQFQMPLDIYYLVDEDDRVRIGHRGLIRLKQRNGAGFLYHVIALVEVVADPDWRRNPDNDHGKLAEVGWRAILKVTHNLVDDPIDVRECVRAGADHPNLIVQANRNTAELDPATFEKILDLAMQHNAKTGP